MFDTALESGKDTNKVKPWSLSSRKILLLGLGDNALSPCGPSLRITDLWRKPGDEVRETLFNE